MEAPEEASAGIDPGDKTETLVLKFLPCISKLDDGSEAEITGNLLIHLKIEAEEITVQKFIEVLGEKIAWGSGQEVELSCYDEKGNYERITTNPRLVGAIGEGRTGNDSSELAIFAELIDASEDSVVGFVPSKAAESINDEAFLSTSDPVLNVADLGQNQMPTPSDLNLQGEGPFVDWSKVYLPEATDFAPEVIDEVEMCKLMGIPVDEDVEELSPVPPSQPAQPAPRASYHDEVTRLFKDAANDVDDENDEEICCVYDEEHPVFEVGRMWPNMKELKMSFKTYAVNKGFVFRTAWTDKYRYCVKCKGVDGKWSHVHGICLLEGYPVGLLLLGSIGCLASIHV
ncbi:uncharacterized protein LOC100822539 [Brachypodium distachyon]|uniref:uncharacterized protein LOC100822539 n=1 Tax=Brachypodium distachyon TaxID=15368 RepID=UPI00053008DD|nr:uncharacterized protein LOC100822539 [Brachypodium distachyon]|eukprot:XP_024314891.1 uncharacterized protein LOC100822539 [Brachypodium distachyon]